MSDGPREPDARGEGAGGGLPELVAPGSTRHGGRARHRVAMGGLILLCLGWATHGREVATRGLQERGGGIKGADYIQFYTMGSLVREGRGSRLYDTKAIAAEARRRISPRLHFSPERNPYGPQVAVAFAPLARLPFTASLVLFSLLSLCGYAAAVWLLWRQAPALAGDGRYVALVAAACPALLVTLRFGQISTLTLLAPALAVAALAAERRFLAGVCLGLLAYKPQLLVVALPMLVLARDWRCLGGILAAAAAQLGIAWAAAGTEAMQQYFQTLLDLTVRPDLVMLVPQNAHSLRGFLRLLGLSPAVATAVGTVLILASAPTLARRWRGPATPLMKVSLLVLLTLLLTPHLLTYDLVLLALPILALAEWTTAHPGDADARRLTVLAVALYIAPFSPPLAEHTHVQVSTMVMAVAVWVSWALCGRRHLVRRS